MSSGDYSRKTFSPARNFSGVLMQQGRVQLDADWNELVAILDRRFRVGTIDILGRCVALSEAFRIGSVSAHSFTIERGRMYVDGLLAENHGTEPSGLNWQDFDPYLMEQRATHGTPYNHQPYYPNAPDLPQGSPYAVYIDVWQREVTHLEQPDLVEKALGVDTTTRLQTIWQVKAVKCASATQWDDLERDSAWSKLIAPSAGRLTTGTAPATGQKHPRVVPPVGSYRGPDNCLYRIEIHAADPQGGAFFKWSRDNGSVETAIDAIDGATLTVDRVGRDAVLRFGPGDWVEITDDWREFAGKAGEFAKVVDVIDARKQIVLSVVSLPTDLIPSGDGGDTYASRHTRVRRWDQSGVIRKADGTVHVDLDNAASAGLNPGVIPVATDGATIVLENGVTVTFSLDTKARHRKFHVGDYWVFAARTIDASVEHITSAPPHGICHHYGCLAFVHSHENARDCRTSWPAATAGQEDWGSMVRVKPDHITATRTLQATADHHAHREAVTIFLAPGVYSLTAPLVLERKHSGLTLQGSQGVILQAAKGSEGNFQDGMIVVTEADHITLRGLAFNLPVVTFGGKLAKIDPASLGALGGPTASMQKNLCVAVGVRPVNCTALTLRDCTFSYADASSSVRGTQNLFAVGVFAGGALDQLTLQDNAFVLDGAPANVQLFSEPFQVCLGCVVVPSTSAQISQNVIEMAAKNKNRRLLEPKHGRVNLTLAGTVVPASITEGLLRDNSFKGLAAAGLIYAETEAIKFQENTVRQCYSGFWILGRQTPPNPNAVASAAQITPRISSAQAWHVVSDPVLEVASSLARSFPLPAPFSGTAISLSDVPATLIASALPYGPLFNFDILNQLLATMESAAVKAPNNPALGCSLSLLFSNNRIDAQTADITLGVSGGGLVLWGDEADKKAEAIISGNRIRNNTNLGSMSRAISTTTIFNIRCAMHGNVILNEGGSTPGSLLVPAGFFGESDPSSTTGPTTPSRPIIDFFMSILTGIRHIVIPSAKTASASKQTSTAGPSAKSSIES
jgi:hypothetical protein